MKDIGKAITAYFNFIYLLDKQIKGMTGNYPASRLTDENIDKLIDYLKTIKKYK